MDLSIVIVNWNTRDMTVQLLEQLTPPADSALAVEVLVVDNQSSDDSVTAIRERFPKVVVLPQPCNGGFAYGVNRGLETATGRHVVLVNTDVELAWAEMERLVAYAEAHPEAGIVGPRIDDEHGDAQLSHWESPTLGFHLAHAVGLGALAEPSGAASQPDSVECVSGCVFLIQRAALDAVPTFDEGFFLYFEEVDYCDRVRAAGFEVHYAPVARMVHQGGISSAQAKATTFLAFKRSCLRYHAKHSGRFRAELVRLALILHSLLRAIPLSFLKPGRAKLHWQAVKMLATPGVVGAARKSANPNLDAHTRAEIQCL